MYIQSGVWVIISIIKEKFRKFSSMRVRIFIAIFLGGVFSAFFAGYGILNFHKNQSINARISEMQRYCNQLTNQMVLSNYFAGGQQEITTQLNLAAELEEGRILVIDGNLKVILDTYRQEEGKTLVSKEAIKCLKGISSTYKNTNLRSAELALPLSNPETKEVLGGLIVTFTLEQEYSIIAFLEQKLFLVVSLVAVILAIFSFLFSNRLTRPLKGIVKSINHVTEGYMDEEVLLKGYYEITQISDSFNAMLKQMRQLEESRQEFVSNVSHELKTPITSIKVLADSLLAQEEVPVELYREFMQDINAEIERENKIINDLLSMVKLDKKNGEMHIAEISINELLEIILKRLKPIAKKRNIELVFESFRPVLAEVDEVKISLAISNLIENAIKYNEEDGWVRVSLNADHKYFYVKVADSGIGIPEDAQNHIFERFYRVDKARSRETGGTGLGLSITKNVVLMHKGAIKVYSKENEGTTFTMRIPLSYIA